MQGNQQPGTASLGFDYKQFSRNYAAKSLLFLVAFAQTHSQHNKSEISEQSSIHVIIL
jgi:hypothetical protein